MAITHQWRLIVYADEPVSEIKSSEWMETQEPSNLPFLTGHSGNTVMSNRPLFLGRGGED